jgi:hypothetical protein
MPTERRLGTTTPCPPKAATERTIAPRLRGSVMPSSATTSGMPGRLGVDEVARVGVLVGRHLHRQALVHRAVGEPVELPAGRLQHGDGALGGELERLTHPVVGVDPAGDVHRRHGHVGAQRLEHRVAPGDHLAARLVLARARAPLPVAPVRRFGRLGHLVGLVVRAVGRLGRRALALEPTAALTAGADLRRPSCSNCASRRGAGSCRPWVIRSVPAPRTNGPGGGVLERDACGGELVADGVRGVVVTSGTGVGPGREAFLDERVKARARRRPPRSHRRTMRGRAG